MEKEIRQILKNQMVIMASQCYRGKVQPFIEETQKLLNPKGTDEDCCDMEEDDAKRGVRE